MLYNEEVIDSETLSRPFEVGTTGWSADDLDDPDFEAVWEQGRYEIVEGVLTKMAAARFDGNDRLRALTDIVEAHVRRGQPKVRFVFEVDLILSDLRVPRVDAILMTPADRQRQREENIRRGRKADDFRRIIVPPTLLIESISLGHERHDEVLKRQWYAEKGVPNFWLFNPYRRSLQCLVLDGPNYRLDASGQQDEVVRPSAFSGLEIPLAQVWADE